MKEISCEICGSEQREALWRTHDLLMEIPEPLFQVCRCSECGLIYLNPQPDGCDLARHYEGDYNEHLTPHNPLSAAVRNLLMKRHAHALCRTVDPKARILEIGCGDGSYLRHLKDAGAECFGLEMRKEAADHARRVHGLDVLCGMLDDTVFPSGRFDIIIMRHVLEHVPAPTAALLRLRDWIKPGGRLIFSIPDGGHSLVKLFGRAWCGFDAPRHLFTFSRDTIKRLLMTNGFRIVSISGAFLPNDWVYTIRLYGVLRKWPHWAVNLFSMNNLLMLGLFAPISIIQGLRGDSGRMEVTAVKEGIDG